MSSYMYFRPVSQDLPPLIVAHQRDATASEKAKKLANWANKVTFGEVTGIVGCVDSDHFIYSDGQQHRYSSERYLAGLSRGSATPATAVAVQVTEAKHRAGSPSQVAFLCAKHMGVLKRLITHGKASRVVILREKDTFSLAVNVAALVAEAEARKDQLDAEAEAARKAYLAENRVGAILRADTELSREAPIKVRVERDQFGASRVIVGSAWGGRELSVPDARRLAAAVADAFVEAHEANEKELAK